MKMQLDIRYLTFIYQEFGRQYVLRMLTIPGGVLDVSKGSWWTIMSVLLGIFPRANVKRMLFTIPGGPLLTQQKKNKDAPGEIIAKRDMVATAFMDILENIRDHGGSEVNEKRDAAAEALLSLIEEYANVDND